VNGQRFLSSCGAILGLALLGAVAGLLLMYAHLRGHLTMWQALGQPPATISAFVPEHTGQLQVTVLAEDGKAYVCHTATQPDCWEEIILEVRPPLDSEPCMTRPNFITPTPPGLLKSEVTVTFCHAETAALTQYALLQDGTVWRWDHFSSSYLVLLEIVFLPLCGAWAGVMASAVLLLAVWWKRWRPANKKP
jgi:hypothetical protein